MSKVKRKFKIKVVVVDYDDTVVDFLGGLCRLHNQLYGTCVSPSDLNAYNFNDVHTEDARGNKVEGSELRKTFEEYEPHGLYAALSVLPEARHAMKFFKNLGYKIIILTARKPEYEKQTLMNILNENIPYDEIIFCPSDLKAKKVRELGKTYNVQMFVDDKAETVRKVSEECKVKHNVLINCSHNKDDEFEEDVIRVNSLFDSVRYLKDLT